MPPVLTLPLSLVALLTIIYALSTYPSCGPRFAIGTVLHLGGCL